MMYENTLIAVRDAEVEASQKYDALVCDTARGKKADGRDVLEILRLAERSVEEFETDVAWRSKRDRQIVEVRQIEQLETAQKTFQAKVNKLYADFQQVEQKYHAEVLPLEAEVRELRDRISRACIGIGLFVLGGTLIGVGKTIGLVATIIASVAKVGLMGFSILSGAISAVTMTVGTVVSAFSGVAGMIGMVFGGIATAVGTALSVLATVGTAVFGAVGAVIAAAFSPLGLVLISLGAVAGACFLVYRNASAIGNTISKVFQGIVGVVKNAAASVYAFLNRFTEFKIIFGTINVVRGGLEMLGKTILWIGNSIVKPTFSVIFGVFRQLASVAVTVAKTIGSALIAGFGKILGVVSSVFRGVVSVVATVAGKVVSVVGSVFSGIASLVGRVLSPVINIIGVVFQGILKFISPIGTALKTVAGCCTPQRGENRQNLRRTSP